MTLTTRWLVGFAFVVAACSVSHRSVDFACERQEDCATGRSCVDGFCVAPADASVQSDGGMDARPIDASACPQQCTSCDVDSTTCTIDCALNGGACNGPIKCPEGWNCSVRCSLVGSCSNGLSCPGNRSCEVTCSGRMSCRDFTCGSGPCDIACTGPGSCNELSCGDACACDIDCVSGTSCNSNITCKSERCTAGRGCTSSSMPSLVCNECPLF